MNIPATILYSELATMAAIAGSENFQMSFGMGACPRMRARSS